MFSFIKNLLPGFITEDVGFIDQGGMAVPLYPMSIWDVEEDGEPACVITVKSFRILGWSVFGKADSEPMDYAEWKARTL